MTPCDFCSFSDMCYISGMDIELYLPYAQQYLLHLVYDLVRYQLNLVNMDKAAGGHQVMGELEDAGGPIDVKGEGGVPGLVAEPNIGVNVGVCHAVGGGVQVQAGDIEGEGIGHSDDEAHGGEPGDIEGVVKDPEDPSFCLYHYLFAVTFQ